MSLTSDGENADMRYFCELIAVQCIVRYYCSGVEEEGQLQKTTRYNVILWYCTAEYQLPFSTCNGYYIKAHYIISEICQLCLLSALTWKRACKLGVLCIGLSRVSQIILFRSALCIA